MLQCKGKFRNVALVQTLPEIKEEAMCVCFEIKLCKLIDISKCVDLDMGPILISVLNAIHLFQLCTSSRI